MPEKRYKESARFARNSNQDRNGPWLEHRTQGSALAKPPGSIDDGSFFPIF